jgi:hypothetical protein
MQELLLQIIAMLKEIRDLLHEIRTLLLSQQQQRRSS